MKTLLLFENHPPDPEDASRVALLAVQRGGSIVCLCCLPIDCEAYGAPECWHEVIAAVKKAVQVSGKDPKVDLEILFRFYEAHRALPERLQAGDVDLVIVLQCGGRGRRKSRSKGGFAQPFFQWKKRREAEASGQCPVLQIPKTALKSWNWHRTNQSRDN